MNSSRKVILYTIDVAVGAADSIFNTIEAIFHTSINGIEAVSKTIGNAAKLSIYVLVVESFEEVRASERTLYCGVAGASTEAISEEATAT
jgi:hypothetical protein